MAQIPEVGVIGPPVQVPNEAVVPMADVTLNIRGTIAFPSEEEAQEFILRLPSEFQAPGIRIVVNEANPANPVPAVAIPAHPEVPINAQPVEDHADVAEENLVDEVQKPKVFAERLRRRSRKGKGRPQAPITPIIAHREEKKRSRKGKEKEAELEYTMSMPMIFHHSLKKQKKPKYAQDQVQEAAPDQVQEAPQDEENLVHQANQFPAVAIPAQPVEDHADVGVAPDQVQEAAQDEENLVDQANQVPAVAIPAHPEVPIDAAAQDSEPVVELNGCDDLEEITQFLNNQFYDKNTVRPSYSPASIQWSPEKDTLLLGVRSKESKDLVGFFAAVKSNLLKAGEVVEVAILSFLCVNKELRTTSAIASSMIKEVKRRLESQGIRFAIFSATRSFPTSYPRSLVTYRNYSTVLDEKFAGAPATPGFRKMKSSDLSEVVALLHGHLRNFQVATYLVKADVAHWILPREGEDMVHTFVVEDLETGLITDFFSVYTEYYTIPDEQPEATSLKVAVSYYNASTKTKPQNLVRDVLVSCKKLGFDCSVAFDTLDNQKFLNDPGLDFRQGQDLRSHFLYPLPVDLEDVKPEETTFSLILP